MLGSCCHSATSPLPRWPWPRRARPPRSPPRWQQRGGRPATWASSLQLGASPRRPPRRLRFSQCPLGLVSQGGDPQRPSSLATGTLPREKQVPQARPPLDVPVGGQGLPCLIRTRGRCRRGATCCPRPSRPCMCKTEALTGRRRPHRPEAAQSRRGAGRVCRVTLGPAPRP